VQPVCYIKYFSVGVYAVYTVISGALTISDCVDAQKELQKEMEKTRKDLKKRGIIDEKDD